MAAPLFPACPTLGTGPIAHCAPSPRPLTHLGESGRVGGEGRSSGPWGSRRDSEEVEPWSPASPPTPTAAPLTWAGAAVGTGLLQAVDESISLQLQVLHQLWGVGSGLGLPLPQEPEHPPNSLSTTTGRAGGLPARVCQTWSPRECSICPPCPG